MIPWTPRFSATIRWTTTCWISSALAFGTGEAKSVLNESIRGTDLFLMVDVCNYSLTYTVNGHVNHMSPDDHYQDLKRIISAANGKGPPAECDHALPV